jgi:type III secretion protein J
VIRALTLCSTLSLVGGCSVAIADNLDEHDANQAVLLLERADIAAEKEQDTQHEGRFRIEVTKSDAESAVALLAEENLPPRAAPGVLEALGHESIVSSRLAEQARWTAGVAGDLERSLRGLDGVLSARVHLAVPPPAVFGSDENPPKPSASVLMRHRGATPPVATEEVQRLVAGAVPGLSPEQVNVVLVSSPAVRVAKQGLAHFGPIAVTRGSVAALRGFFTASLALNAALAAAVVALWLRVRRTGAVTRSSSPSRAPQPRGSGGTI